MAKRKLVIISLAIAGLYLYFSTPSVTIQEEKIEYEETTISLYSCPICTEEFCEKDHKTRHTSGYNHVDILTTGSSNMAIGHSFLQETYPITCKGLYRLGGGAGENY